MRRPGSRERLLAAVFAAAVLPSAARAQSDSYEASSGLMQVPGFVIFFSSAGPLSYATPTPKDLPAGAVRIGEVKGRGCQYGVSTPITGSSSVPRISGAKGQGGFERALGDIRDRYPDLKGIYDVKVDDHVVSILTVYQRLCTEVTAKGFK